MQKSSFLRRGINKKEKYVRKPKDIQQAEKEDKDDTVKEDQEME